MNNPSKYFPLLSLILLQAIATSHAASWLPISEEDRAAKTCPSDPDAGAEFLYVLLEADDEIEPNGYRKHYNRLKVYDERGVKQVERIRISYNSSNSSLRGLAARVVKPDGTIHELAPKDIYSQVLHKDNSRNIRIQSFSPPNIEVGDIVEYQYKVILDEFYYSPENFHELQKEWPIRKIDVRIRPTQRVDSTAGFKWTTFNCDSKTLKKDGNGFFSMQLDNLSSYPKEPYQDLGNRGKAWIMFYHTSNLKTGNQFWNSVAKELNRKTEKLCKPTKTINAKAAEILKGINETDKLKAIYDYCRTEIIHVHHSAPDALTQIERSKIDSNNPASKVLELGYGNNQNINVLFCSLAKAAGYDARLASAEDKNRFPFLTRIESQKTTVPSRIVAIKDGEKFNYFAPGNRYPKFGALHWRNEGAIAIIADNKKAMFAKTPVSQPSDSISKTKASFDLDSEGNLTGHLESTLTGHSAAETKEQLDNKSTEAQKEYLLIEIHKIWPNAIVTDIEIENEAKPLEPLIISLNVSIPQFAEKVGSRIFINPSVAKKNSEPELPKATRKTNLFFKFKSMEIDDITITLPKDFELEEASAPVPFGVAKLFEYDVKLSYNKSAHQLIYNRELKLSMNELLVKHYPVIKSLYDKMHIQDQHSVTLKQIENAPENS
ncbi:DUF3857 and transglutaminase domain-containing protein [Puniceicoccaceae bacterium K14]|nr:DUF3857 and transglutaminase domain-containing protein [Puniceicoccaceae bacterium K14]